MKKKKFLTLAVSMILIFSILPSSRIDAQTLLPFAGIVSFPIPCTCTANLWIWFTPLYLGGPAVLTGPMVYSPYSTILYANFFIGVPSKYHLGSYIPGIQSCWIFAGFFCFPLPTIGHMFQVGTN